MKLVKYRLASSTIALLPVDGHKVVRTVPAGSVVMIDGALFNENQLVEVSWNGKKVMMFAQDVRSRGEEID
jgi:hypothetical protein